MNEISKPSYDIDECAGLVHGWVWNKHYLCYEWIGLYWPAYDVVVRFIRPLLRRFGYWSGVESFLRGLHWDRKRRN